MFYSKSGFTRLSLHIACFIAGISLVLFSPSIAPSVWAKQPIWANQPIEENQPIANTILVAQAQLTTDQLPISRLSDATKLQYDARINGALNVSSIRHQGRRFAIYQFEGTEGQLIRINLVGGLASNLPPDQLQTGALLINPAVILLDPDGQIIAQQPEQTDVASALISMNLPMTGTYAIFVTSTTIG
ncbi:MAG TPA: hypothetical protein V6C65_02515, partial [Allocoleopsis sp.]